MNFVTSSPPLLFTCFKCGQDFKLRIHLRSHAKRCKAKKDPFSIVERPSCDKNTFMNLLNLQVRIKSEALSPEPQKCTYKLRDGIIVINDDDDDEDFEEDQSKKSNKKRFLLPKNHQKAIKASKKTKMKIIGLRKIMDVDCTSALGQLIDYKKCSIKSYIGKVCVAKNYEKWCNGMVHMKNGGFIPSSGLEQLRRDRTFRSAMRSSSGLTNKCFVNLFHVDKIKKFEKYFIKEPQAELANGTISICPSVPDPQVPIENGQTTSIDNHEKLTPTLPTENNELRKLSSQTSQVFINTAEGQNSDSGFIKCIYSLTSEPPAQSTVVDNKEEEEDEDCYVYRVDMNKQADVSPARFSLSCFLCHEIIVDCTSSYENIRKHYFTKHQISNFALKATQTDKGKIWKLVDTSRHKKNPQTPVKTSHVFHSQVIDNISNINLATNVCGHNLWKPPQEKTDHNFYSDVICID